MKNKKNFFIKSEDQKNDLEGMVKDFGAEKVSFLDAVVGGEKPTSPQYIEVYSESTFVRIIIPPKTLG